VSVAATLGNAKRRLRESRVYELPGTLEDDESRMRGQEANYVEGQTSNHVIAGR